jgi:hypothetical protein
MMMATGMLHKTTTTDTEERGRRQENNGATTLEHQTTKNVIDFAGEREIILKQIRGYFTT